MEVRLNNFLPENSLRFTSRRLATVPATPNLTITPLKSIILDEGQLVTNDAGEFFITNPAIVEKLKSNNLDSELKKFILSKNFGFESENSLEYNAYNFKRSLRKLVPNQLKYVIIVPTLRCDLKCSYCQVSRANLEATGFDWDQKTVDLFIDFIEKKSDDELKIEFQGGEPTLRLDLVKQIIDRTLEIRPRCTFIICTNLQNYSAELRKITKNPQVQISTSFDGNRSLHTTNRTQNKGNTDAFFENLKNAMMEMGAERVNALPTITDFNKIEEIINGYKSLNLNEIFLRPVNYQGFARKKHKDSVANVDQWIASYLKAVDYIIEYNELNEQKIIETNLALHLRRIFQPGNNGHVDLRSPNPAAQDYLVIDFDGSFYPTDEARMLTRIGLLDLKIGSLPSGVDQLKVDQLNRAQDNASDPACQNCTFQPFCGVDVIDKISRYQTADYPTLDTYFCKFHMAVFKKIFTLLEAGDISFLKCASLHLGGDYELNPALSKYKYD